MENWTTFHANRDFEVIGPSSGSEENTYSRLRNIVKSFHDGLSLDGRRVIFIILFILLTFIRD